MMIKSIKGSQVLDSRGNPTVACRLETSDGFFWSMVPSGASTGTHEALELRDATKAFGGKAVTKAVSNINGSLAKELVGKKVSDQKSIDDAMIKLDGTPTKSKLGANAILAVSMAVCRAGAAANQQELFEYIGSLAGNHRFVLPVPQLNVMNGGKHAGLEHDIQEQMFFPDKAKSFAESLQMGTEAYHALKKILSSKHGGPSAALLGDEGGFAPASVKTVAGRLNLMEDAISDAGYAGKISFAIDSASSEFFKNGSYQIGETKYSSVQMADFYSDLVNQFPIVSLEDGLSEDDWSGWVNLTQKIGSRIQLVGDDLLVTNPSRIERAIREKACNALLLKVNQIGSVSESIDAFLAAKKAGWNTIVSHRSGETEDAFIADLVVGLGTGQSKFGAPARSERTAKYNRLLAIEETLGKKAIFGK